jgi:hypothetical protein
MISPKGRLILVVLLAGLFLGWIGYLAFLAYNNRDAIVLSRQQLLAADLDVVANVESLDKPVMVCEVLWPKKPEMERYVGRSVLVANLKVCKVGPKEKDDWKESGLYILPLVVKRSGEEEKFEVAQPGPRIPGYDPAFDQGQKALHAPRIYPATPETVAQLSQVLKP